MQGDQNPNNDAYNLTQCVTAVFQELIVICHFAALFAKEVDHGLNRWTLKIPKKDFPYF